MAGIHDLGGRKDHFGPIPVDQDPRPFHARWEGRVWGVVVMTTAILGRNLDRFRSTIEQLPAARYFTPYYQRWLAAIEARLIDAGVMAPGEVDARIAGRASAARGPRRRVRLRAAMWNRLVPLALGKQPWWLRPIYPYVQTSFRRSRSPARWKAGDPVVVIATPEAGHTRRPGYVWGRKGTIVAARGAMVFADARARNERAAPQHMYTVAFAGAELWGDGAEPGTTVHVDLFESYLEDPR